MDTTEIGNQMEDTAAQHLCAAGLTIVERNFSSRFGEIDLIARDGNTLVFVEVRFRRSNRFGGAGISVDQRKQRKLLATANSYLQYRKLDCPCRFDVIAIEQLGQAQENLHIQWIANAFGQ
ncbi:MULTISPECIES: YraN family protein [Microbulbifer]|uniref:UPF0102 protein ACFQ2X_01790 n=1 Tax=Microbulbifer celer TaxID=435905 RepID=A0ABW3U4L1_9GAMM|nr:MULTISPECIES: YraN family protein [Microbulbifer]UFN57995.1 YraN family protein [Microbulbifer celer]